MTTSLQSGMVNAIQQMGITLGKPQDQINKEIEEFLNKLPKNPPYESAVDRNSKYFGFEEDIPSYGTNSNGIFCNPGF